MAGPTLRVLAVLLIVMEVFFALMYAFIYQYNPSFNELTPGINPTTWDIAGLFIAVSITIVILIGIKTLIN